MDSQTFPPGPPSGPPPFLPQPSGPAPQPPPRSATGWKVTVFLLGALLFLSVLVHLATFVGSVLSTNPTAGLQRVRHSPLQEVLVEDHDALDKIAVITVEGLIMDGDLGGTPGGLVQSIQHQLQHAGEDDRVKALVLKVDSPGGEVLASDEIAQAITEFQKDYKKPVVASMGSLAASGGYYISAPCRWIVANELTITGSIGVIMQSFNYRGLMDKVGLRPMVFKSGKFKDMLSGSKPESDISDEEKAMIQNLVNQTFNRFKQVVQEGRQEAAAQNQALGDDAGRTLADDWEAFADGRILSGNEAYQHGFVDELGNFETALARARALVDIDAANVVRYEQVIDLSHFLRLFSRSDASAQTVQVDLGLKPWPLKAGQLYFLAPHLIP